MLNVKRCITGAKCYKNRVDDFVYKPIGIPSYLRLGISDFYNELSDAKAHEIEYIVRPKDSYPSGGYGSYGGYDMILIKLKKPVENRTAICLPRQKYMDSGIKAIIAGYGKNRRAPCQVGTRGPEKFRYCGLETTCRNFTTVKFKTATCRVSFPYEGEQRTGCQQKIPSPAAEIPECQRFLRKNHSERDEWPDIDEFELYDNETLKRIAKCYREMDDEGLGWCGVNMANSMNDEEFFNIKPDSGWGFCTPECYPDHEEPFYGVAREKLIDVLDENFCEQKLTGGGKTNFKVKPEVLCVGYNHSYNIRVYVKDGAGRYSHIESGSAYYDKLSDLERSWYIVGPGSCHGDSGGPAFQPALQGGRKVYVLLGVTSSGTSNIGHCGGIDNPTHYTRIKKFLPWIRKYVPKDSICWAGPKNSVPAPFT